MMDDECPDARMSGLGGWGRGSRKNTRCAVCPAPPSGGGPATRLGTRWVVVKLSWLVRTAHNFQVPRVPGPPPMLATMTDCEINRPLKLTDNCGTYNHIPAKTSRQRLLVWAPPLPPDSSKIFATWRRSTRTVSACSTSASVERSWTAERPHKKTLV